MASDTNYSSFAAYDIERAASNEFAFPEQIADQWAANIIGNKFVTPTNGPVLRIDGENSSFVLNSIALGSPGYIKYIFGAPITLKQRYTREEFGQFEPMNSTMFYPTESTITYGTAKPSIHNLRVHPFRWTSIKEVLLAISFTYNVNNYVRTDDYILPYKQTSDGGFVAVGNLAYPSAVYLSKYSNINNPNLTGFQAIKVVF